MKGKEGRGEERRGITTTPTLSSTSYSLQLSQEAKRRRAAAGGEAAVGGSAAASQPVPAVPSAQAAAAPAPAAASGPMGVMKSLYKSLQLSGEEDREDTDANNPFHKKKEPEVAIIDPDSYYAGARPATALGHGQYQSDFTNVSLDPAAAADASAAAKKAFRRGAKNKQEPTQTMNMNIAPRRHSKDVASAVQDFLNSADSDLDSSSSEIDDDDSSTDDDDATYQPPPPRRAAFFPFGDSSARVTDAHDSSKASDVKVPVRSSKLGFSYLCSTLCKSWRKILIILFFLVSAVSLAVLALTQGWAGDAFSFALPQTQTIKTATNRRAKEFHTQYEWPRNGHDKDEAYRTMIHDRTILAHNAQMPNPTAYQGRTTDRGMIDANEQGTTDSSSPLQLGFAYEQTGDGPWRIGYRDGLGGISQAPPDLPSQKYILMYQQEQHLKKEQEEKQQQQQQHNVIQDEHKHAQEMQRDQYDRRTMQLPMAVTIVDKVVPQPINLP